MKIVKTVDEVRVIVKEWKKEGRYSRSCSYYGIFVTKDIRV